MALTITFPVLLVSAGASWILYYVLATLYSVYLGPLSRYPGPKLLAATRIPLSIHRVRGDDVRWFHKLHLRYGDVVRVAPTELSYTNGQAWREIYSHYGGVSNGVKVGQFQKDQAFYGNVPAGFKDLSRSSDPDHARMRRILSNVFSSNALRQQESLIRHYVDLLIEKLGEMADKNIECDMGKMLNYTTFDIMADLTAGESLNCLSSGENHPQMTFLFRAFRLMPILQEARHYPVLVKLRKWVTSTSAQAIKDANYAFVKDRIDKRLVMTERRSDIMGIIMDAKDGHGLTKPEIYGNMRLFMTAGTETSASLLSGLTYYLLRNPKQMNLLKNEIRETFSTAGEIDLETLAKMPYLNACLEEGLRVYPPVPTILPRLVPSGGATICGEYVPENVSCPHLSDKQLKANECHRPPFMSINSPRTSLRRTSSIQLSSSRKGFWDDPEYASDNRSCLQPFSIGPRNCIGKNLAYLEMRLILAQILWHFDLSAGAEKIDWANQKVYFLWEKSPLPVQVKRADRNK